MVIQTVDVSNLEIQILERAARYQRKYKIASAEMAWMFLRIGTSFYFKDICSRGLNGDDWPGAARRP